MRRHAERSFVGAVLRSLLLSAVVAIGALPQAVNAQDYPSRPIRIVVPFAAGAGNDLLGRLVAAELTKRLGGQVFVENKPGAASQLGTDLVAKSPADGYTLLWTASDGLSVLPAVKPSIPYRIPEDFDFIGSLTNIAFVIAANPKVPAKTIQELIAHAKANPGKLNYGSAGLGSAPHMGLVLFANAAQINMVHVPFAGLGPALNAAMAGTVDLSLTTSPFAKPQGDAGTIRNLAITGPARDPLLPEVPTLRESGLPVTVQVFFGLLAPAGTPEPIVARLRREVAEVAKDPAIVERLSTLGYPASHLDGDAYRDTILKDLEQWRGVAKAANIQIANEGRLAANIPARRSVQYPINAVFPFADDWDSLDRIALGGRFPRICPQNCYAQRFPFESGLHTAQAATLIAVTTSPACL